MPVDSIRIGRGGMESEILDRRRAGALISSVKTSDTYSATAALATWGVVNLVLLLLRKLYGGLWVGGELILYKDKIVFKANALNNVVYSGSNDISIALDEISSVDVRFGLFTRIIGIERSGECAKFRCYGADEFAARLKMLIPNQ
ncbi:MAG TPA: hypothetical protein VF459_11435 [Caulobacteraceae bacterium]